jgi:hypothetical protein
MTFLEKTTVSETTLPALIERASQTLLDARSSAEVLEARDMARMAYDAAKSAGRIAKAKKAHDEVLAAVHRAQADALLVEARAKMRLADEYDGAQDRGEVQSHGGDKSKVGDHNFAPTAADIGLRRDEIHEARKLRDAEKADPGKAERTLNGIVARGEEPTKAKLRQEMVEAPAKEPKAPVDPERRKLAQLTTDALIDEVIGLRADLADEKAKVKAQESEIRRLKEQLQLFEGDQAEVIRRQAKIIAHKESEMYRANDKADKALAKAYKLEQRVRELERMEIEL